MNRRRSKYDPAEIDRALVAIFIAPFAFYAVGYVAYVVASSIAFYLGL